MINNKLIPQAPIKWQGGNRFFGNPKKPTYSFYVCPTCYSAEIKDENRVALDCCQKCGQVLDWEKI